MKTIIKLASQRSAIPVLNCVLVTESQIVATDIDTIITIPNPGIAPGLYHGKGFDSDKVRTLADISESEFPAEPKKFGEHIGSIGFDKDSWANMQWVMLAQSDEDTRFYLNGVCFDKGIAVATDGHRIHKMPLNSQIALPEKGVIVPRAMMKYIDLLAKEYKATPVFDFCVNGVSVKIGPAVIESRYIDCKFPDYERAIPADGIEAGVFDPIALKKGLKDIKTAAKIAGTKMLTIKCNGTGFAQSLVNENLSYPIGVCFLDKDSQCFEIGFNAEYLADMPMGRLLHTDSGSPIRVQTDNGLVGVVMPIRI